MISEDPDEDADNLDDETLLRQYLGAEKNVSGDSVESIPDWPPRALCDVAFTVDSEISGWFKRHHGDWRRAMRLVLRAWVVAHTPDGPNQDGQPSY